jgi:hypothetical protein
MPQSAQTRIPSKILKNYVLNYDLRAIHEFRGILQLSLKNSKSSNNKK